MNIPLFVADDMNWDTPSAFGGRYGPATPHLDSFAETARCYRHAHATVAVCLPSRSCLMTGRYPFHNGSEGFTAIHPAVPTLPEYLKHQYGWRTGIVGKVQHCCPPAKFNWDFQVDYADLGMGRDPQRYATEVNDFLSKNDEKPFFLMVNSHDPHRPFHGGPQESQKWTAEERSRIPSPSRVIEADEVAVPGFLPDLPEVRQEVAEYASSCRRGDDCFGAVLEQVEQHGLSDETVVIFLSDNGMAFPFAKTNCYLHSTRTPLMVRWPGHSVAGMDEQHMVSGIDLMPTILEGLGLPHPSDLSAAAWLEPQIAIDRERWRRIPPAIDGRSFFSTLTGREQQNRDWVHTVFHASHKAQRYEMRCIQTREWGYIWNQWSNESLLFKNESCSGRTFQAMQAAAVDDQQLAERVNHFQYRCPEELYHFQSDPNALTNCVDTQPEQLQSMRQKLSDIMNQHEDVLASVYPFAQDEGF